MPITIHTYDDHDLPNPGRAYATRDEAKRAAMLALCDTENEDDLPDCAAWDGDDLCLDGEPEVWLVEQH